MTPANDTVTRHVTANASFIEKSANIILGIYPVTLALGPLEYIRESVDSLYRDDTDEISLVIRVQND